MAKDNDRRRPSDPFSEVAEEGNPFVIFKRLVDDEVSSLVSAFDSLRPHFKSSFEELQKDHEIAYQRFTKNYERATNPERTSIQPRSGTEDASNDTQEGGSTRHKDILRQAPPNQSASDRPFTLNPPQQPRHDDLDELSYPFSAALDRFPSHFFSSHDSAWEEDESTGTHHPTPRFFASSPYAPRRLEQDPVTAQRGDRWRQAFDELLVAQEETDGARDSNTRPAQAPLLSWIDELQRRSLASRAGILRDVLRDEAMAEDAFNSQREDPDVDTQPEDHEKHISELDLYEHFLGGRCPVEQRRKPHESDKPTVTSTLTTTERRCLPDGTVTTKTVLKKRFADGSEVSEEKIDTKHAPGPSHKTMEDMSERPTATDRVSGSLKKETGSWLPGFWSSS